MRCPKCGSEQVQLITETTTEGKDFSGEKGCCGYLVFGPLGLLCGACGEGKQTRSTSYWVCHACGRKWKA